MPRWINLRLLALLIGKTTDNLSKESWDLSRHDQAWISLGLKEARGISGDELASVSLSSVLERLRTISSEAGVDSLSTVS